LWILKRCRNVQKILDFKHFFWGLNEIFWHFTIGFDWSWLCANKNFARLFLHEITCNLCHIFAFALGSGRVAFKIQAKVRGSTCSAEKMCFRCQSPGKEFVTASKIWPFNSFWDFFNFMLQKYRLNAITKMLKHIKSETEEKEDLQKDIFRRKAQLAQVEKIFCPLL